MKVINKKSFCRALIAGIVLYFAILPLGFADVYINVIAVNGKDIPKTSSIRFDLPGELTSEDILDTDGLKLDYSVDDANFYLSGDVTLKPKESRVFRIHIKDKWMVTPDDVSDLKKQIELGFETLGEPTNIPNAQILKSRLESRIDYIVNLQSTNANSVDKRIDVYRMYAKEMQRIRDDALNVDYWRSDPNVNQNLKLIHLTIDVNNPTLQVQHYKNKQYLPQEVKPEDVIDAQGFEVRYDKPKDLSFLFKEEDLNPGEDKKYSIGILDIWNIDPKAMDYLRSRAQRASDFLKDTKFQRSAELLFDRLTTGLRSIEESQALQRPIAEHISAYRANEIAYNEAEKDVETLEKLVSVFREGLQKSKVENILQKIQGLRGVGDISKVMFNKQFEASTAWSFIGWVLAFVGGLAFINIVIWMLRSKDKKTK